MSTMQDERDNTGMASKLAWQAPVIDVFEARDAQVGTSATPGDGTTYPLTHTSV